MSLKSVSPPTAGTSMACSTAPIDGHSRQVTSWCQAFSYPPTSADFSKRTSSGRPGLPGMNGWISSSPKREAKATWSSAVRGWSRKKMTL